MGGGKADKMQEGPLGLRGGATPHDNNKARRAAVHPSSHSLSLEGTDIHDVRSGWGAPKSKLKELTQLISLNTIRRDGLHICMPSCVPSKASHRTNSICNIGHSFSHCLMYEG